ncbi:MAG: DUF1127 domain-containing protein [Paracoccaceae bacterium]|nr:DUF1127 domain-containing protein [Paracoccaceae bacterium]
MALAEHNMPAPRLRLPNVFGAIARFFEMITESNFRVLEANRLNSMTDSQLAARGIKREDIARQVFRDLYYI